MQLETGNYASDSEVIQAAIRETQARHNKVETIYSAIKSGRKSGISDMTPDEILAEVKQELKREGGV